MDWSMVQWEQSNLLTGNSIKKTPTILGELPANVTISFDPQPSSRIPANSLLRAIEPLTVSFDGLHGSKISRTMLPFILCWGVTVHKMHGISLETAVLDLGERNFAHGQIYVAVSRICSLRGLRISAWADSKFTQKSLVARKCLEEYERLRSLPHWFRFSFVTLLYFYGLYAFACEFTSFTICSSVLRATRAVSFSDLLFYWYSFICIPDYLPCFRYLSLFLHIALYLFTLSPCCLILQFHMPFPGTFPLSLQRTALLPSSIRTSFSFASSLRLTFQNLSLTFLLRFKFLLPVVRASAFHVCLRNVRPIIISLVVSFMSIPLCCTVCLYA